MRGDSGGLGAGVRQVLVDLHEAQAAVVRHVHAAAESRGRIGVGARADPDVLRLGQRDLDVVEGAIAQPVAGDGGERPGGAEAVPDFRFEQLVGLQHVLQLLLEVVELDVLIEMDDRPAHVLFQQIELQGSRGGELADAQLPVEEDGADLRALQQVVHVRGEFGQFVDLRLVLTVDGVELLVYRM